LFLCGNKIRKVENMQGSSHIQSVFEQVRADGRSALMPYFTLGYPTPERSLDILVEIARCGADLIELGVPFSDPLADGPTIQHSTQVALQQGMSLARCLEMTADLRGRGVSQPLILMGYINPILAYGIERFAEQAARCGADGFIVPDLPPEEAGPLQAACQAHELALIYLLAPTSTPERIAMVAGRASGFLYLVSLTGVTGARQGLASDLESFIQRVRVASSLPLAVGFGISTPQQAARVAGLADGVIIGSALINAVDQSDRPVQAAGAFVASLRQAVERLAV
jgi:tryptophan synthase alpha chain